MITINGLKEGKVYTGSGGYGTGFWHNELCVDLEELAAGNFDKAFTVVEDIHDTAGMSFREYHGIDQNAKLPDGAKATAIQAFCDEIAERAAELTTALEVRWDGSNHRAYWGEDSEDAVEFWGEFAQSVSELETVEVYDCSYSENIPFVRETIQELGQPLRTLEEVQAAVMEAYDSRESGEYFFTGHAEAAEQIWDQMQDEKEDDE